ncbi:hypothetical protein ccbrp13_23000 [Ktedonobacteria bacterium brp13]|nr:hypothetical protein ccbrp13_23000 [Ktedonobacteria bacterium brp13]
MQALKQLLHHPAGRLGITIGLTAGLMAAFIGEASKALMFVGLCRFLARRLPGR